MTDSNAKPSLSIPELIARNDRSLAEGNKVLARSLELIAQIERSLQRPQQALTDDQAKGAR